MILAMKYVISNEKAMLVISVDEERSCASEDEKAAVQLRMNHMVSAMHIQGDS